MRLKHLVALSMVASFGMAAALTGSTELQRARDRQDKVALEQMISKLQQDTKTKSSAEAEYRLATAYSYAAEVAIEMKDKAKAQQLAEAGIDAAKKAIAVNGNNAEYHRILGQLCGQVIPANPLFGGLKYGQCARDEVNKAIELDGKSAMAYVSRGVGNYYLPPQFGGGIDLALKDLDKALALNANLSEAYLWKGIALRKANRNAEARAALEKALQLDPDRVWTKQQLEKTPAH